RTNFQRQSITSVIRVCPVSLQEGMSVMQQGQTACKHAEILILRLRLLDLGDVFHQHFVPVQLGNPVKEGKVVFDIAPQSGESRQPLGFRQLAWREWSGIFPPISHVGFFRSRLVPLALVSLLVRGQAKVKPEHLVLDIPFHDHQTRCLCHLPEPSVHLLKRDFTYVYLVAFGVERTHPDLIIRGGIEKILVHPIRVVGTVELDSLSDGQGHFSLLSDSVRLADGDSLFDLFRRRRFGLTEGHFGRESEHNRLQANQPNDPDVLLHGILFPFRCNVTTCQTILAHRRPSRARDLSQARRLGPWRCPSPWGESRRPGLRRRPRTRARLGMSSAAYRLGPSPRRADQLSVGCRWTRRCVRRRASPACWRAAPRQSLPRRCLSPVRSAP